MSTLDKVSPRTPFVDRDGYLTAYWFKWLEALHARAGGVVAPSNTDLAVDLPEDAGLEEIRAQLFAHMDAHGQTPPIVPAVMPDDQAPPYQEAPQQEYLETQVKALTEQVAALQREIDGLKQGANA